MKNTRPFWSSETKIVVVVLLFAALFLLLRQFSVIITPILISVILAYILNPIVGNLQRRTKLPRVLVIIIIYIILIAVIALVFRMIIPQLPPQIDRFVELFDGLLAQLNTLVGKQFRIGEFIIDGEGLLRSITDGLESLIQPVIGQTIGMVAEIVESVVWIIFTAMISFYLIKDSKGINQWMENLVPPIYRQDFLIIREDINNIWSSFFRGQLLLVLVVSGILTSLSLIIGLPFPLVVGLLGGALELLGSLGHGILFVLGSLLAFFAGSTWIPIPNWSFLLLYILVHFIFTQVDLNYLIPRIIGRSVKLPPLVVILGIVAGAALAGVMGVLLAAPTIASARILGRYVYALLFDLEPFPETSSPSIEVLPPPEIRWWRRSHLVPNDKEPNEKPGNES
ncbi:MAG: AI-2E family transporter [Anaerolineaceae bacterium]|nr:AI-2E family transporter [Anaerolineaceae bacterium]